MNYWVDYAGHNDLLYKAEGSYWKTLNDFKILLTQSQNEKRISDAN